MLVILFEKFFNLPTTKVIPIYTIIFISDLIIVSTSYIRVKGCPYKYSVPLNTSNTNSSILISK